MKTCGKCSIEKQESEFYSDKSRSDCLSWSCKSCQKKRHVSQRTREYWKAWRSNPENKKKQKEYDRKRNARLDVKERNKERNKERSERRRERLKSDPRLAEEYKEKARARVSAWRKLNKQKVVKWRDENRAKIGVYKKRRKYRLRGASGYFSEEQLAARIAYYGGRCLYCNSDNATTIDHRIPISRGGTNWPSNLVPCCKSCNSRKRDKTEAEYREWLIGFQ